jgi:FixJ family two-component response regulator
MGDGDVLLLDDDVDLLDALAELIEHISKRRVWKARNLSELTQLQPEVLRCALAILDINLGAHQPSGLDALRWLGESKFAGRTVFLTGHAPGFPLVDEARRIKGVRVLAKPITSQELLELFTGA